MRPTYDYLCQPDDKRGAAPWPLTLAYRCYDMLEGRLLILPSPGAALDQDDMIMAAINIARRLWYELDHRPARGKPPTPNGRRLLAWIANNDK